MRIDPEDTFPPIKVKCWTFLSPNSSRFRAGARASLPKLVASVIAVESNFNPNAVSVKSARGLMQLMPETAARFGVTNCSTRARIIDAGTRYLKELLLRYNGNLAMTLAHTMPARSASASSTGPGLP